MNQHEIFSKLSDFKLNLQTLLGKKVPRFFKSESSSEQMDIDDEGADNYLDDLPLTISRDSSPGIKYYTTENSEFARGAQKETPRGIDSFGERDI
jgi:hypothetical protein